MGHLRHDSKHLWVCQAADIIFEIGQLCTRICQPGPVHQFRPSNLLTEAFRVAQESHHRKFHRDILDIEFVSSYLGTSDCAEIPQYHIAFGPSVFRSCDSVNAVVFHPGSRLRPIGSYSFYRRGSTGLRRNFGESFMLQ
jgi:hypothetical protein